MKQTVLELGGNRIPVLYSEISNPRAVMVLGHGLEASKEAQIPELEKLERAGYGCLIIDAPHHGERQTGLLQVMDRVDEMIKHDLYLTILDAAGREMPLILEYARKTWNVPVGVGGISMGGFTAFSSAMRDPGPDFIVSLIGSPDWYAYSGKIKREEFLCPRFFPAQYHLRYHKTPILAITAGRDEVVLPNPTREFVRELEIRYSGTGQLFELKDYPESGHFMRDEDWNDAWQTVIAWLKKRF
jgi:hypothetical protein